MPQRTKLNQPIVFETTFCTYTATEIIGEGGSSRIYLAEDDAGGTWAVKWLDPAKATREKVKRFRNELQFCLKNRHPNIVTVSEHGIFWKGDQKSLFYVMPLYSGSLRDLLRDGIVPEKVLSYFAQILDGVEAAHLQGVIHRDLKPENVLHDNSSDHLLVADFGIARFEEDELYTAVETKDSTRLANFLYAAPEQRTRGTEADQHADIYALGLILNEMFTGEVSHGTGYKTVASVAAEYEYLDDLVSTMIRQTPDERYASVDMIKRELIGRKNEFVTQQRISELQSRVVPVTELDDPLLVDPPRLVGADWDKGKLTLVLNQPVNEKWISALNNMGSYGSLVGKDPGAFSFSGNTATIDAEESQVQKIIDYFKGWLPQANRGYELKLERDKREAEEKQQRELQCQIEEQQARQRVLKNIRI